MSTLETDLRSFRPSLHDSSNLYPKLYTPLCAVFPQQTRISIVRTAAFPSPQGPQMRRRLSGVLILLAACALGAQSIPRAFAQSRPAQPTPRLSPTPDTPYPTSTPASITLGQSVVPLYGPWKFQIGDSPIDPKTGHPLWAEPAFDDSHWESVDLTPPSGKFDPAAPDALRVPGWRAKGHPTYWGWAWYRLSVPLAENPPNLALAGPAYVNGAYQVFSNGDLLGGMGEFGVPGKAPTDYWSHPAMFLLPHAGSTGPPIGNENLPGHNSQQILAFRVWMPSWINLPDDGGIHAAPLLGEAGSIAAELRLEWAGRVRGVVISLFDVLMFSLLAIVIASLILFDRSDRVYLVVATVLSLNATLDLLYVFANLTTLLSFTTFMMLLRCVFLPLMLGGWMLVWWIWFRLTRPVWVPRAIGLLVVANMVSQALGDDYFNDAALHSLGAFSHAASVLVRLLFLPLMVLVVGLGIRKEGREGWLVLPAFLPLLIGQFQNELDALHIPTAWRLFGFVFFLGQIGVDLSVAAISLLLLRRLLLSVRRQRQMALDVKQAQEVQQVILPEARVTLPGLTIESEYRPAREVGGDFFQIIPHKTDGSLLIVAGDVTGKGLKAGMLVALLVGAVRSTLDWSSDPMAVLQALNKRVLGRADAQATCLALSIAADGAVTLANAGHMPPYLNGEPVAMEGALPLGMSEAAEFSLMRFQLKLDDSLVLLSDGIVEATDPNGNLFGFDRVHSLLHSATTAAEIASAAQSFGQQDDISVISVTRTAVAEPPTS